MNRPHHNFSVDSLFPSAANLMNTPDSHNTPYLADPSLCPHSCIFHSSSDSSLDHEAHTVNPFAPSYFRTMPGPFSSFFLYAPLINLLKLWPLHFIFPFLTQALYLPHFVLHSTSQIVSSEQQIILKQFKTYSVFAKTSLHRRGHGCRVMSQEKKNE